MAQIDNKKTQTEAEKFAKEQAKEIWDSWISDSTDCNDSYIIDLVDEESN